MITLKSLKPLAQPKTSRSVFLPLHCDSATNDSATDVFRHAHAASEWSIHADACTPHRIVEADSEIRRLLKDKNATNGSKYMWLTVGNDSILAFLRYEFLTTAFGGMRGALGLFCRQLLYPAMFRRCGRGVVFGRNVTIRHPGRIEIGDNVVFDDNVVLDGKGDRERTIRIGSGTMIARNSMLVCKGGTIDMGPMVIVSVNCTLISESQLTIGERSLIAGHCYINAGGNHGKNFSGVPFIEQPRLDKGGIRIQSNCWICANATVLDGVDLGPNTIVGAAALVNRSMPPNCIVGGVPAIPLSDGNKDAASRVG